MRLSVDKHWSLRTCIRPVSDRSYEVELGGKRCDVIVANYVQPRSYHTPTSSVALEYGDSQNEAGQKVNTEHNPWPPVETRTK